jgi:peptidylprolyl isomerase
MFTIPVTFTAPLENMPPGFHPRVGEMMGLETRHGRQIEVVVTHVDEKWVTMDGNRPLAGRDLTFDIEVVKKE